LAYLGATEYTRLHLLHTASWEFRTQQWEFWSSSV
jgi:hypothetical protein